MKLYANYYQYNSLAGYNTCDISIRTIDDEMIRGTSSKNFLSAVRWRARGGPAAGPWRFTSVGGALNSWVDVQSECKAERIAPWSSASPASTSLLRYLVSSIFNVAKTSFWRNLFESMMTLVDAQPTMSGKTCTFQKIKPFERCFMKFFHYRMTLNITKQLQLTGMSTCSRYAKLYPVPNTTLSLIIADRACSQYRSKKTYEAEPRKLEQCEVVHSHSRRKPDTLNDWNIEMQNKHVDCDSINDSFSPSSHHFILLLTCFITAFRISFD
uniref:Uncharacterized protein n=1 Tax=Caenorhabditis japonica TaxID=281687 RepID=A0A8R1HUW1_CAEJA